MPGTATYPVLLAHGIARFDVLTNGLFRTDNHDRDDGMHYFRNIRTHLQSYGFVVRHSRVSWAARVEVRAQELRRNMQRVLAETKAEKVHIIAHSSGGLDARQMLYKFRHQKLHQNVASLTTIGTPHHGSPVADVLASALPKGRILGIDVSGLADLTTRACKRFNDEKKDWERRCGVHFQAYAGAQPLQRIFAPLKAVWPIIHQREGPNDGLVSVRSAKWKSKYFVPPAIDADHLNLIGWWEAGELWGGVLPFELEAKIKNLYLTIAQGLAKRFPVPCL